MSSRPDWIKVRPCQKGGGGKEERKGGRKGGRKGRKEGGRTPSGV